MKTTMTDNEHILNTCRQFLALNEGDESTEAIILSMTAEILDMSVDSLMEVIG